MAFVPLNDDTPIDQYTATASQTTFAYTWLAFAETDIKVYVNDVLKTLTTDYTISAVNQENGANVVFNSGLNLNDEVTITREVPIARTTGYTTSGSFRAETLNIEQNKELAVMQQLKRDIDRCLRLSSSSTIDGDNLTSPVPVDGAAIGWDGTTGLLKNIVLTDLDAAVIGVDVLAFDTELQAIADLTLAADKLIYATGASTVSTATFTAAARSLVDDATVGDMRTTLDVPQSTGELVALGGLTSAANKIPYFTGSDTAGLLDFLDEDNMASNSATALASQQSIKAYIDTNAGGSLRQAAAFTYTTEVAITTTIPADTTIPQSTEGDELFSESFTPTASDSVIIIQGVIPGARSVGQSAAICLFVDSATDADQVVIAGGTSGSNQTLPYSFKIAATDTSARTYKIRVGPSTGTLYVNRTSGTSNIFGAGKVLTTMNILEVAP